MRTKEGKQPTGTTPIKEELELKLMRIKWEEIKNPALVRIRGIELTNLQSMREDCVLSQRELSGLLGRNKDYIGALERYLRGVTISGLEEIANALGCFASDLTDNESLDRYLSLDNLRGKKMGQQRTADLTEGSDETVGAFGRFLNFFRS